jgi:uncharacterized membrane protein
VTSVPHAVSPGRLARPTWGSILLALSGWVALALTFLPGGSVPRAAGAFAFLLFCPGAALVRWWPDKDLLSRSVIAVAMSMALTVLVAEGLTLGGTTSGRLALVVLAGLTSIAAIVPAGSRRERRSPS